MAVSGMAMSSSTSGVVAKMLSTSVSSLTRLAPAPTGVDASWRAWLKAICDPAGMGDRVGGPSTYRPPAGKAWLYWVEVYCGPAEVGAVSEGACVEVVSSVDWEARERDLRLYSMVGYKSKVATSNGKSES